MRTMVWSYGMPMVYLICTHKWCTQHVILHSFRVEIYGENHSSYPSLTALRKLVNKQTNKNKETKNSSNRATKIKTKTKQKNKTLSIYCKIIGSICLLLL